MRLLHALTSRTLRGWLFAVALVGGIQVAHAGYAEAIPPAGFSRTGDAWTYRAANANEWLANTVRTNATLNVGGRAITLPAAMRMASNAPRFAAASLFSPGGIALALGAAAAATLLENMQRDHQMEYNEQAARWERQSSGFTFSWNGQFSSSSCAGVAASLDAAYPMGPGVTRICVPGAETPNPGCVPPGCFVRACASTNPNICNDIDFVKNPTTVEPVTYPEFEQALLPYITPEMVPDLMPGQPIPVDLPIINPSPGDFPVPQVRRIPLGEPVPQPAPGQNYPMQFRQPVLDIKGSPTQSQPWRVDVQPKDIITEAPQGEPAPNPVTDPVDVPDPNADPAQSEAKEPGLCERFPDILACQKPDLDTPVDEVPKSTKTVSYTELNLWGGGSCPANVSVSVHGQNITALDMANMCGWIQTYLRPMVIFASAMSAMFILMGSRGGDSL